MYNSIIRQWNEKRYSNQYFTHFIWLLWLVCQIELTQVLHVIFMLISLWYLLVSIFFISNSFNCVIIERCLFSSIKKSNKAFCFMPKNDYANSTVIFLIALFLCRSLNVRCSVKNKVHWTFRLKVRWGSSHLFAPAYSYNAAGSSRKTCHFFAKGLYRLKDSFYLCHFFNLYQSQWHGTPFQGQLDVSP